MSKRTASKWCVNECEQAIKMHQWHYTYFMQAGSPVAAAVYTRAIERLEDFIVKEKTGMNYKYKEKT